MRYLPLNIDHGFGDLTPAVEELRPRSCDLGQRFENFAQMHAQRLLGFADLPRRDRIDDAFVLFDQPADLQVVDAQEPDAIHLRLDALDHAPGIGPAGGGRQRMVEELVEPQERGAVVMRHLLLSNDLIAQLVHGRRPVFARDLAHDIRLDRLAHEAHIHDGLGRNPGHIGAALGQYLDQALLRQLDECLAHRLAADRKCFCDLRFRNAFPGHELRLDDPLAQNAMDLRTDSFDRGQHALWFAVLHPPPPMLRSY